MCYVCQYIYAFGLCICFQFDFLSDWFSESAVDFTLALWLQPLDGDAYYSAVLDTGSIKVKLGEGILWRFGPSNPFLLNKIGLN